VYLVCGALQCSNGAVQWSGAGWVPKARDHGTLQQEELILAGGGEDKEAVDKGRHWVCLLHKASFRLGLYDNGGASLNNSFGDTCQPYNQNDGAQTPARIAMHRCSWTNNVADLITLKCM
jgi:hypothetical protein